MINFRLYSLRNETLDIEKKNEINYKNTKKTRQI
jgi:hypothetical protein